MRKLGAFVLPILICSSICSCATTAPAKKEPAKAPVNLEKEYLAAKASADSGDAKKAYARLKRILEQGAGSDIADDAHFLLGNLLFSYQRFPEALENYNAIVDSEIASPLEVEATLRATRTLVKLNRYDEAEKFTTRLAKRSDLPPEQAAEVERARVEIYTAMKQPLNALRALVALADRHPVATEREKARIQANEILESQLSESDLIEVGDEEDFGFLRAPAKYRSALLLADQRDFSKARRLLADVAELAPGSELGERATNLISQIDARNRVDAKTVGVVLPLSGKQATIGYRTLKGIQQGLGVYGRVPSNFRLAVIDSEGNPDVARRAIERLVTEDNVIAIVGGVLSKTASAEAAKAQELGVPTIMLSQKAGVTQAGEYIFRNALTSERQVEHLVEVAMTKLGMKNFAIMFPNDAYGVEFADLFWDEVLARGGAVTAAQPYDPKETDFRAPVQRLGGLFYVEDRADEYQQRLKVFNQKNPKRSARQSAPTIEEILPPAIGFDGIFIPDSARAVGLIAPMLAFNNITKVRLLGSNIWNTQSVVTRGQRFVENSVFVDAVLTSDPVFQSSQFFTDFKTLFDEEPGAIELQAYDSALVLRQLISGGEKTRVGLQEKLATVQDFPGAIGQISVTGEREFRRPLSTLSIKDGKIGPFDSATAVR